MKNWPLALVAILVVAGGIFSSRREDSPSTPRSNPENPVPSPEPPDYTYAPASPDGIGKFFLGREISQVMGHPAIGWLERSEREREEAPSRAIDAVDLHPQAVIADIGAGSGYYSFRLANKLPQGKVIAVDIQPEMLDFIRQHPAYSSTHGHVVPHLGKIDDLDLPAGSLDGAWLVDAYHEFSHPREMLTSLYQALKPGGRVFILEFRGEDPNVPIKELHKMTEQQIRREWESCGFVWIQNRPVLPWQHFIIMAKP